ncbi:MAG: tryptophan--tRNA ligase [Holosporaceae bacterium]|nr:MAG: tryptophan--tRNA ligase [Holosporaceae bacterium]
MKKRILSGIQPTGNLHLGNYLGALKNWVHMQNDAEALFCVVDLHALTVPQNPEKLKQHIIDTAMMYVAVGIDPEKSTIFVQSMVPAHAELSWLLSCQAPLGWLNRMTQFKDKAGAQQDKQRLGLYAYPVLMAADILTYQATHVPVGEDQKQHLELARDLAQLMNRAFKDGLLTVPEPQIMGAGTRVMSLKDGTNKMSKSDPSDNARINMLDDDDVIARKIKKATTDTDPFPDTFSACGKRPHVENLISIFAALKDISPQKVCDTYGGANFSGFKDDLADATIQAIGPIRDRFKDLKASPKKMKDILNLGAEKANKLSQETLSDVKRAMGLPVTYR